MSLRTAGACVAALIAAVACGGGPKADPSVKAARLAPPDPVVTCAEWARRAAADPEIAVERVPAPIALEPPPIPKRLPKGVLDKNGRGEVRIRVLVDTLGVADMRTFTVVKSTHPTLTRSVRAAVAKWKFTPAEIGGCKVPRDYNWAAVAGGER
jgi:outer membrane biosynthesis protein TonB